MFQAQLLLGTQSVYGPWMPRGGDLMSITLDLISTNATGTDKLTVEVFTKKKDDSGDGAVATGTSIQTNTVGRSQTTYSALNDLVRYKFTPGGAVSVNYLFRMLSPVFFDTVKV